MRLTDSGGFNPRPRAEVAVIVAAFAIDHFGGSTISRFAQVRLLAASFGLFMEPNL